MTLTYADAKNQHPVIVTIEGRRPYTARLFSLPPEHTRRGRRSQGRKARVLLADNRIQSVPVEALQRIEVAP